MKSGAVQHVFTNADTDLARFERGKALGFSGIEPDLTVEDLADPTEARLASIKAACDATGLEIPALSLGVHSAEGFLFASWRGDQPVQEIRKTIQWCHTLGAKAVLVPFFCYNEPRNAVQRERVADVLAPLCREAEALGVDVCFEGMLTATELKEIAAKINSPAFGVYFDMGNSVYADLDPAAEAKSLGSLVRRVHIKDTQAMAGDSVLGEGRVDFPAVAAALSDIAYEPWMVFEAFGKSDEDLVQSMAFAKKYFPIA